MANQPPQANAGTDQSVIYPAAAQLSGSAIDDGLPAPPATLTYAWSAVSGPGSVAFGSATSASTTATFGQPGTYVLRLTVSDSALSDTDDVEITSEVPAAEITPSALPTDTNLDLGGATSFLYDGDNPVQVGVEDGAIIRERTAVVHGIVYHRDTGAMLPGVTVRVLDHPEWGETVTRSDGRFDLALNGDTYLVLVYEMSGFVPVQRQVLVQPQRYTAAPDVALVPLDPIANSVDLTLPGTKVARGSQQTDEDGARTPTLFFPEGVTASLRGPGGLTPISGLTIRLTEFTTGENGPDAMPAELPPASKYTYALELSADETTAAGALGVEFSEPIPFYVENFLEFPVGTVAPLGYYDREQGLWVPLPSGIVLEIVSETGGRADVDVTGDNVADDVLALLGMTDAERTQLAALYEPGQELWRVMIPHFTPMDINWSRDVLPDLVDQAVEALRDLLSPETCTDCPGSSIELENQVMNESIGLTGAASGLNYTSGRVRGDNELFITVTGPVVPGDLSGVNVKIDIAGQITTRSFLPLPNQTWLFTWDGHDGYGRNLVGTHNATVIIDNLFVEGYSATAWFGAYAVAPGSIGSPAPNRRTGHISKRFDARIAAPWLTSAAEVGGWTLSQHHVYDPGARTVWLGTGDRVEEDDILGDVRDTILGHGVISPLLVNNTPTELLSSPIGTLAAAPGGGWWATSGGTLLRVDRHGLAKVVSSIPFAIIDMAVGPRGDVYLAVDQQRVFRFSPSTGVMSQVAGTGAGCSAPITAPTPALSVDLCAFPDIAATPDGNVFITANGPNGMKRIYRLSTDGMLSPFALAGANCPNEHGLHRWCNWDVPAMSAAREVDAYVGAIYGGPDGSLYINGGGGRGSVVMRIDPDGIMRRWIGGGGRDSEGVALNDVDGALGGIALSNDRQAAVTYRGGFAINGGGDRIRAVANGTVVNIAGHGFGGPFPWEAGRADDGKPAESALYQFSEASMAYLDNGDLIYLEFGWVRILRASYPGYGELSDHFVASPDGSEVWHFNAAGRHLETLNALTGAALWRFAYDPQGRLLTMTDSDGNVTTITRDAGGGATSIVGPYGETTAITLDANGNLRTVTNPNNETVTVSHSAAGLLMSLTTPRGHTYTYTYSPQRDLQTDNNPAGGAQTLSSGDLGETSDREGGRTITRTTILGRVVTSVVEFLKDGRRTQSTTGADGSVSRSTYANGSSSITAPSGAKLTIDEAPDPRFGLQAPVFNWSMENTAGGLKMSTSLARLVALANPNDPFSVVTLTDTITTNGRAHTSVYNAAARTFTQTSPEGRTSGVTIDQVGRVVGESVPGLASGAAIYDARGRLQTISAGPAGPTQRNATLAYNAKGYLASVTDAEGRVVGFAYDNAGRVTRQILPDLSEVAFAYDASGNLVSVTPPGRPAHTFTYNQVEQPLTYTPPVVPGVPAPSTSYEYNLDGQLTKQTRPGGLVVNFGYDAAGRMQTITFSRGTITMAYDATTGQLASITEPGGEGIAYLYLGDLVTLEAWSGPVAGSVGYGYDNDFRVASQSVNGGNTVAYGYDDDGLLTTVGALSIANDPANGLVTGSTLATVTDALTYNPFGEVDSYAVESGATDLYGVTYTRDRLGRITRKVETLNGAATTYDYGYDAAGRLATVKTNDTLTATYTYDANGNRTTGPGAETATHDAQDRQLTYGGATYTYSANGELASKTAAAATTTYSYDEFGNLTQVGLPDGDTVTYVVDGLHRRVGKRVNGTLEEGWLYDGGLAIVAQLNGSGALVSRFVYANGINVPDYLVQGGVTYRVVTDHLGSLRLVVRASDGHVVQRMNHDEFGRVTEDFVESGFTRVPFGFAGGLYDPDTGLVRFGTRDYDAESGRWTTKDSIGFAGGDANLYAYAGGDPVNSVDLDGMHPNDAQAKAWDKVVDWGADMLSKAIRQRNLDAAVVKRLEGELKTLQTLAKQSHRALFRPLKGVGGYPSARFNNTPCPPRWVKSVMGWVPPELRTRLDAFQKAIAGLKGIGAMQQRGLATNARLSGAWRGFGGALGAYLFLTGDVRDVIPPCMYRTGVDPYAKPDII